MKLMFLLCGFLALTATGMASELKGHFFMRDCDNFGFIETLFETSDGNLYMLRNAEGPSGEVVRDLQSTSILLINRSLEALYPNRMPATVMNPEIVATQHCAAIGVVGVIEGFKFLSPW